MQNTERACTWRAALSIALLMPVCVESMAQTQPPSGESIALEVFKGPRELHIKPPLYPFKGRERTYEGWVEVSFMIDAQGRPYEPVVTDSSGREAFEKAVLEAVKDWTFEPASIGGKPVHAGYRYRHVFNPVRRGWAGHWFRRDHLRFSRALEADDRVAADAALARMGVSNFAEETYYNLARYHYYVKWGSEAEQLAALRRLTAAETGKRHLRKNEYVGALQTTLALEFRSHDYSSALKTWKLLHDSGADDAIIAKWSKAIADVETLRKDDRAYSVMGELQKSSWFYSLFKNRFQVVVSSGHVSEIKLRCDKQYVFFRFDPQIYYRIADKYGDCGMELVGQPGTRFELIQS